MVVIKIEIEIKKGSAIDGEDINVKVNPRMYQEIDVSGVGEGIKDEGMMNGSVVKVEDEGEVEIKMEDDVELDSLRVSAPS